MAFQVVQLASLKFQLGGLFTGREIFVLMVRFIGRWSLPIEGPLVVVVVDPRWGDIKVRSIVDNLRLMAFCLVPRSGGVVIIMLSFPLRMMLFGRCASCWSSSRLQLLGTYTDIRSIDSLFLLISRAIVTATASIVCSAGKTSGMN